ncbi:MAG: hypothetical protein EOM21_20915 [Gammaproteobacteria bacterium]|nr:hypothetical protein [Gammaproteobacteria bacterium]
MENKFPKEILNSNTRQKRITIMTKKDYLKHINSNLSACNLFATVYNYTEFGEKYPYRPNYDTAIIDRLWFDFDLETILEDKTVIVNDCYSYMKNLHEWALKHDYRHICRYTGSGFDVTIFTLKDCFIKNKKDCIKNAVIGICDELGIKSDAKTLGDIARVCRVTNSYNFKSKAKRFCIPLTQELIDSGHKEIRKTAKKQKFYTKVFGTKLLDIRQYDYTNHSQEDELFSNVDIGECEIEGLSDSVPICIKYLLSKKIPNYTERRPIIVGLRELAFSEKEIVQVLKQNLDSKKFYHCVFEEGQVKHLYNSKRILFPTQKEMLKMNSCPFKLGEYCENAKRGCMNYNRK